jgi:hypothetical protein
LLRNTISRALKIYSDSTRAHLTSASSHNWKHTVGFKRVWMLVHRLDVVAFKMGRRQGGPSRTGVRGHISKSIRNRRVTQPPAHFQRNPPGRGQLAVFRVARSARSIQIWALRSRLENRPNRRRRYSSHL